MPSAGVFARLAGWQAASALAGAGGTGGLDGVGGLDGAGAAFGALGASGANGANGTSGAGRTGGASGAGSADGASNAGSGAGNSGGTSGTGSAGGTGAAFGAAGSASGAGSMDGASNAGSGAGNSGDTSGRGNSGGTGSASGAGNLGGDGGLAGPDGAGGGAYAVRTAIIQDASWNIAAAHISERQPENGMSNPALAPIGKTSGGKRSMALYRFPLTAGVAAEDVVSAHFYIRLKSGNEPRLAARPMDASWTATSCWDDVARHIAEDARSAVSEPVGQGWHRIDVTGMAKGWLSGERNNNGLAIEETQAGRLALYYSSYNNDDADCPKLEISYAEPLAGAGFGDASLGGAALGGGVTAAPAGAGAAVTATAGADVATKAGAAAGSGAAISVGTLAGGVAAPAGEAATAAALAGSAGYSDSADATRNNILDASSSEAAAAHAGAGAAPAGAGGVRGSLINGSGSGGAQSGDLGSAGNLSNAQDSLGGLPGGKFGKFGFEPQDDGNCMSYALRDLDAIAYGDLIDDSRAFQAAYDAGGADAALQYAKRRAIAYVERHKSALQIDSFREIDGFQAAIDADAEYRIAMRAGFRDRDARPGIQVDADFDYHFMAQMSDGSWAEKVPGAASRLAPGSNYALDPGKYPWTQGYMWGYLKWNEYYSSDTAYFAVKKSSDAFTEHKKAEAQAKSEAQGETAAQAAAAPATSAQAIAKPAAQAPAKPAATPSPTQATARLATTAPTTATAPPERATAAQATAWPATVAALPTATPSPTKAATAVPSPANAAALPERTAAQATALPFATLSPATAAAPVTRISRLR